MPILWNSCIAFKSNTDPLTTAAPAMKRIMSMPKERKANEIHSLLQHLLSSEVFPDTNLHSMLISEQPVDRSVRRRGGKELWARLNFIKHRDVEQENITLRHNHFQ